LSSFTANCRRNVYLAVSTGICAREATLPRERILAYRLITVLGLCIQNRFRQFRLFCKPYLWILKSLTLALSVGIHAYFYYWSTMSILRCFRYHFVSARGMSPSGMSRASSIWPRSPCLNVKPPLKLSGRRRCEFNESTSSVSRSDTQHIGLTRARQVFYRLKKVRKVGHNLTINK